MRETVKSMRAYFIVVGLVAGWTGGSHLWQVLQIPGSEMPFWFLILLYLMPIITLVVSLAFLFAGLTAKAQFEDGKPRRIQKIILFSGLAYVLSGAVRVGLIVGFVPGSRGLNGEIVGVVIGLLITWYLYTNARRLAGEALEKRKEEARETFE